MKSHKATRSPRNPASTAPATGPSAFDIGCGTGHAMNLLAREFPSSRFYGYDIAEDAIESARAEATNR